MEDSYMKREGCEKGGLSSSRRPDGIGPPRIKRQTLSQSDMLYPSPQPFLASRLDSRTRL